MCIILLHEGYCSTANFCFDCLMQWIPTHIEMAKQIEHKESLTFDPLSG